MKSARDALTGARCRHRGGLSPGPGQRHASPTLAFAANRAACLLDIDIDLDGVIIDGAFSRELLAVVSAAGGAGGHDRRGRAGLRIARAGRNFAPHRTAPHRTATGSRTLAN